MTHRGGRKKSPDHAAGERLQERCRAERMKLPPRELLGRNGIRDDNARSLLTNFIVQAAQKAADARYKKRSRPTRISIREGLNVLRQRSRCCFLGSLKNAMRPG
jgi:hypothetical protein